MIEWGVGAGKPGGGGVAGAKIVSRRLVVVVRGGFTRLEVGVDEADGGQRREGSPGNFAVIGGWRPRGGRDEFREQLDLACHCSLEGRSPGLTYATLLWETRRRGIYGRC